MSVCVEDGVCGQCAWWGQSDTPNTVTSRAAVWKFVFVRGSGPSCLGLQIGPQSWEVKQTKALSQKPSSVDTTSKGKVSSPVEPHCVFKSLLVKGRSLARSRWLAWKELSDVFRFSVSWCFLGDFLFKSYSVLRRYCGFWFCAFVGFLCENIHVSCAFPLARFLLFLSHYYFLNACLFSNEKEEDPVWVWVGREVEIIWEALGEGNSNQNVLYGKKKCSL